MSVAMLLLAVVCQGDAVVIQGQPTAPVHIHIGQSVSFEESGGNGTGFSWSVTKPGKPRLKLVSQTVVQPPKGDHPMLGGPNMTEIKFIGEKKGKARVQLIYSRVWEKHVPPHKTVNADVIVE